MALYLLALVICGQLLWSTLVGYHGTKGTDFLVIREAGAELLAGKSFYDLRRVERDLFGPAFHLPPFAAVVAGPFALLGEDESLALWRALSLMAYFGALVLLLGTLGLSWQSPLAALALAAWGFCWPARATFIHGQWDAFFLFALALGLRLSQANRELLAGAVLGLAGSVKPYPLFALGAFLVRRRWRALFGAALVLLLCLGLSALLAGPRATQTFFQRVLPHLSATTAYAENQSLAGFLARLIEPEMRPVEAEAPLIYLASRALLVVGLLLPLLLVGLRRPSTPLWPALLYAAWICAAPIGIPTAWMHYQSLLLLPLLVLAAFWYRGERRPSAFELIVYGAALALILFGDHYTVLGPDAGELWKPERARVDAANDRLLAAFAGPAMLLISYKLYGALALFGLCLVSLWRSSQAPRWPGSWSAFLLGRQDDQRRDPA